MPSSTVRLFIGIDLSDKIKKQISDKIDHIKAKYKTLKWIEPKNYHITLIFLGEINQKKIASIEQRLQKAVFDTTEFNLISFKLGVFPNKKRIIYLSFFNEQKINQLAKKLKQEFQDYLKQLPENKFVPHITLAKGKRSSKQQYYQLIKLLDQTKIKIEIPVDKVCIFTSQLTAHRSIYHQLFEIQLHKDPKIKKSKLNQKDEKRHDYGF
ncbi:MAG: RNA 2',3'-cyclic phosphodiesterase [Patescibacteria group bacterium]|nr:MAG: RNA 2',3'-cyclic phosphodiesterase [Patescibacteria group bacterium]